LDAIGPKASAVERASRALPHSFVCGFTENKDMNIIVNEHIE
jgi:hypothetical protein